MMLCVNFHRHTMTQVMGLQHGRADHAAIDFRQPPDVFSRHRLPGFPRAATLPARPEQRRLRFYGNPEPTDDLFDVAPQELHDCQG
ncbi:MAG: hypothetical protein U0173_10295 [Nitrospiraceae bacterium]